MRCEKCGRRNQRLSVAYMQCISCGHITWGLEMNRTEWINLKELFDYALKMGDDELKVLEKEAPKLVHAIREAKKKSWRVVSICDAFEFAKPRTVNMNLQIPSDPSSKEAIYVTFDDGTAIACDYSFYCDAPAWRIYA